MTSSAHSHLPSELSLGTHGCGGFSDLESKASAKIAPGTLAIIAAHGVGSPRDLGSDSSPSLLKFRR